MPRARSKYTVLCDGEEDEVLELLMRGEEHEVRKMVVAFFDTYLLSYKKLNALSGEFRVVLLTISPDLCFLGIGGVTWNIYRNNKPLSQSALYRIHSLYCNLKNHPEKTSGLLYLIFVFSNFQMLFFGRIGKLRISWKRTSDRTAPWSWARAIQDRRSLLSSTGPMLRNCPVSLRFWRNTSSI